MMRYAELHGNMQRRRIKSLRGNTLSMMRIGQLAEATKPMLSLAEATKPMMSAQKMLEGVGSVFKHEETLGRWLPRYKAICSCASG